MQKLPLAANLLTFISIFLLILLQPTWQPLLCNLLAIWLVWEIVKHSSTGDGDY